MDRCLPKVPVIALKGFEFSIEYIAKFIAELSPSFAARASNQEKEHRRRAIPISSTGGSVIIYIKNRIQRKQLSMRGRVSCAMPPIIHGPTFRKSIVASPALQDK